MNIKTYTKQELFELANTTNLSNAKRTLTRLGYSFTTKGRGEDFRLTITQMPTAFKLFAIEELGFSANTQFDKLEQFCYYYFCCDDSYRKLTYEEMAETLKDDGMEVERHTIKRWIDKLKANNLVATGKPVYYSISYDNGERTTIEISEQIYKKAWSEFFKALNQSKNNDEAIRIMYRIAGGKCYKRLAEENNAIYKDLIDRLIDILENE